MEKSPKTLITYNRLLNELRTKFDAPADDLKFAKKTSEVISYVESLDKSYASKKLYYAVLVSVLRDLKTGRTKLLRDAEEIYRAKMVEYNNRLGEIAQQQSMTPREIAIWNSWEDVLGAYSKLKAEAEANLTDKKLYQQYVILSLYTCIPPLRCDYSPVRITNAEDTQTDNKLVVDASGVNFILHNYKTARQYGVQRLTFPPDLEAIIRHWLTLETSGFLFSVKGKPASESWLSGQVRNILQRLTGKATGIAILRHSYITYMRQGEAPVIAQQSLANSMLHSNSMSQLYRRI
jgi:hypothetical protein